MLAISQSGENYYYLNWVPSEAGPMVTQHGFIKKELDGMGIEQVPSAANFITTIWGSEEQAAKITQELLEKGVIVRLLASFGWPDCIRISIGLEKENQKCIACLKEIL